MLNRFASLFTGLIVAAPLAAGAQQLDLPRPSPFAKLTQTVGLTDITIDYSSPAVKGRKIWGALVPWEKVWRAGANAATKVTFSKDVTIQTTAVPAGSYSFFVIPHQKGNWTLILNKVPVQGGAFDYKQDQDLLRVDVKPEAIPNRERLAYLVSDFTNSEASLALEWEKVRLRMPVKLGTEAQVNASLQNLEDNPQNADTQAARYELDLKIFDVAMKWVEKSLALKEDWLNDWTKAQILAGQEQYADALSFAQKAQDLGAKAPTGRFFFEDDVKKALVDWKGKKNKH